MIYRRDIAMCLARDFSLTQDKAEKIVDVFCEVVMTELENGGEVKLQKFGVFKPELRKSKPGRNVRTGEEVVIPDRYVPVFKPSSSFEERVSILDKPQ